MIFLVIVLTVCLVSGRSLLMKAASDKENSLPQILVIFTVGQWFSIGTDPIKGILEVVRISKRVIGVL